ncbi:BspA family leucine-rich repeat surface protein [Bifidobacterium sp. ESL0769]|uniref:BspA family leucine-rich repeat surface protein n=1 Tax=Bifidobacterium sp. ESL0769 TaxID=2983229 RepID=UPI0023F79B32|nr:BspA family leucine-rich repeat surface protein [Bifidobacterium sp. ESL0769]WEV67424.1 BspA family leucine-rich repeat surface protein [Bifidobacterium sp. ESL0769]
MHSHGNRTPPPQNEPSLNNPNNSNPAASSQVVTAPSASSASATIPANGPSTSSTTTSSISAASAGTTASSTSAAATQNSKSQTGNAAGNPAANQVQSSVNAQASNKSAAGLTHTNAAGTPTAKPKTLSTIAAEDFSNASKTLAAFLQRMKSASHTTGANHQTTPAATIKSQSSASGTLPHATAAMPADQSPIGTKTASPLTRSTPTAGPQDEPGWGPRYTNPQVENVSVDPYDDGAINISGHADEVHGMNTWVALRVCPAGTPHSAASQLADNPRCSGPELLTDGMMGGNHNSPHFTWGPGTLSSRATTVVDSDFKAGPGYYDIWVWAQNSAGANSTTPVSVRSYYYCSHAPTTKVTLTYNMSGMPGASTPSYTTANTSAGQASIQLAYEPSHPSNEIFDGWYLNYSNYNAGQTVTFGWRTNATYTVTPRWHWSTTVTFNYNLNGMSGSTPGSLQFNTSYSGGSFTLPNPPSHPDWQIFEGWSIDGSSTMNPGQTYTYAAHDNGTHTITARWHTRYDTVTIHYDMGATGCNKPPDQSVDSTYYTNTTLAGTPATCPAHTAFDGWTINGNNYNPSGTFSFAQHVTATYTATARTHAVQAPTGLTAAYHIAGTVTLSGTSNVVSGDKVTACMTEGTGDTACQPAITATSTNSAWQWTATFPATDYTTRYGIGHSHHFTAKLTSKNVDSTQADLKGILPWTTLSFDKGTSGGTAPASKDALTDTTSNKATFTLPGQGSMTAPANAWPDFTGWSDGTTLWQPGSRDIPTTIDGASTDASGHTTLTLTAQWHVVTAPSGVTATWSHTTDQVSFKASGLPTGTTSWQIRYKTNSDQSWWTSPNDTMTPTDTYHTYYSDFTIGDTWTAQVRATADDGSGHTVTSDWSQEVTGILPYMDITLKPGEGTGPVTDPHVKSLVDPDDHNAHLALPTAADKGMSGPDGRIFANQWNTSSDGSGTSHASGGYGVTIPASEGTPDGQAIRLTLYAQWKPQSPAPAAGHCTDGQAGAGGWAQWGTPAGPVAGLAGQNTAAACWVIDGTVLRLSGGTSPDYQSSSDIPWASQAGSITKVSIEGDLTLNKTNNSFSGLFGYGNYYHKFTTLTTRDGGKLRIANQAGRNLFDYAYKLADIDPSGWDVSQATDLSYMFHTTATSLDLSGWKTGNVTTMESMFEGASNLTSLDLSGWDTRKLNNTSNMFRSGHLADIDLDGWITTQLWYANTIGMFPASLQRLRLGPQTRLPDPVAVGGSNFYDPFKYVVRAGHTWHEWDWPKGHHPADSGPVGTTPLTAGDGTADTLRKRCESTTPQGVYIRDDLTPTWTDLTYNLNGGTGDTSLPTQVGAAATSSTPKRDGLAIDTTFKDGTYTIPDGTGDTGNATHHITTNKPHSLFNGWTIDTGNVTANASGGTATVSNHTITAAKGAGGTAAVTAQWAPTPEAMPGTPQVGVTPHTTDQGGVSVSVSATLDQAMPAIDATGGDPAKPAVNAGGTVKVCAKPSSQNDDFYPVQCSPKTSTTAGSQTITPEALQLPGSSAISGNAPAFPDPGEQYTLAAMYTLTDPQTRNQIDSTATQAGGGLTTGTLPWADTTFDTNDSHGGTGTAPTSLKSFVDTASGKAWATLPNATTTMKPGHFVFAGWSATASAANPDQGMGDPASRVIQLDADGATETQTTLYAVWHKLGVPTVTGITRDHMNNTVTITGTSTPWTSEDDITLDLTPLDGQTGLTPAGARHVVISPTDQHGTMLAYDGHTAHPWTLTLTADELPKGGRYRTVAKLEAHDRAWRDTNADLHVYSEPDQQNQPAIDGYFHHALPLTGGQRTMLIITLTLLGVFLIGMSQLARNRRRWHHQYQ